MKLKILKPSLWGAGLLAFSIALFPNLSAAKSNIVIGLQQEPTSLDPTSDATASIDGMLSHNVYESLTTVSEAGEVLPALADS
ncbi:MAG: ABC transporter substrate-binding protein, partial [Rhodobacteraceae bacterium]